MSTTLMSPPKMCCTCGKDVTTQRRMKDSSTGRYWCYDCGNKQPGAKNESILCPRCRKPMSAHSMYRVNDQYICHDCHEIGKTKTPGAGRGKLIAATVGVLLVAGVSAFLNGWI